jgi:ADP-heptose:LPS heptosyltransferase
MAYRLPLGLVLPKAVKGNTVVLIRDDGIGDLVYNTSYTVSLLAKAGYDVYAVVKESFLEAAKLFLPVEKLLPFDNKLYRNSLKYRFGFLSRLRRMGINIALGSVIASSVNCDLLRYCGARERWGYMHSQTLRNKINYRGIKSVRSIRAFKGGNFAPILAHEAALLSAAFPNVDQTEIKPPTIVNIPQKPENLPKRYIVYISEAGNTRRCYPRERLLPILKSVAGNIPIVMLGSSVYKDNCEMAINLTGKTSLKEAIAITSNSAAAIGSETGLTHVAHLSNIPTAIFLGGGHWGKFLPMDETMANPFIITNKLDCFCCGWKCKYNDFIFRCVNLNYSEVHDKLTWFLSQTNAAEIQL